MTKQKTDRPLDALLSEYLSDLKNAGISAFGPARAEVSARLFPAPKPEVFPDSAQTLPLTDPTAAMQSKIDEILAKFNPNLGKKHKSALLAALAELVSGCAFCPELVANRSKTVFGDGNPAAELVFIGEGPGADEDTQGLPFVGRSGRLLTDIIEKGMEIPRSEVYICNIVRCRPPGNRNPSPVEAACCRPFLDATLNVIRPKYICCLGSVAVHSLLDSTEPIGRLRGRVLDYNGAKVVCTYHPAYLLRNPPAKKETWEDVKLLMRQMGLPR